MGLLFDSLFLNLVVATVAISVAIYVFFRYRFGYWKRRGVVQLQPSFPFGNITDLFFGRKSFGEIFAQIYQELRGHPYGGIYRMFDPTLVLVDPEIIRKFMVKDFEYFRDRGFSVNEDTDPLMANLVFLGGPKWRHLRVKLSPTFTSGKMKMMFQKLAACTRELADVVSEMDGADVEIRDVLARYGTDVIGSIAFGLDVNSLRQPDHEFRVWGRRVFSSSPARALVRFTKLFVPIDSIIRINNFPRDLTQYFLGMVRKTIEYREKNNVSSNDFMQLLIQLKNQGYIENKSQNQDDSEEGRRRLTLEEVAAQAFIFFLAGFETSSTTISFCLHELTMNPTIQARLQQEVDDVVSRTGGNLTYEDIVRMPYLDMVVSETLRKYPPVPLLNRVCTTKYHLEDNLILEKGTNIVIPLLGLHFDPTYYPDPEKFDPNRFSKEEIAKRQHFTYLPFGEGPRICIELLFKMSRKEALSQFIQQIHGRPVVVKLNSGVDYRGVLACLDGYMNIALEQTEEYVNGQLKNKYGDAFIRGNNVLYISTQKRRV